MSKVSDDMKRHLAYAFPDALSELDDYLNCLKYNFHSVKKLLQAQMPSALLEASPGRYYLVCDGLAYEFVRADQTGEIEVIDLMEFDRCSILVISEHSTEAFVLQPAVVAEKAQPSRQYPIGTPHHASEKASVPQVPYDAAPKYWWVDH